MVARFPGSNVARDHVDLDPDALKDVGGAI